jgi:hypothetical protein
MGRNLHWSIIAASEDQQPPHLKRILRLDRLRLRGPSGAKDEFLLAESAETGQARPASGVDLRRLRRSDPTFLV